MPLIIKLSHEWKPLLVRLVLISTKMGKVKGKLFVSHPSSMSRSPGCLPVCYNCLYIIWPAGLKTGLCFTIVVTCTLVRHLKTASQTACGWWRNHNIKKNSWSILIFFMDWVVIMIVRTYSCKFGFGNMERVNHEGQFSVANCSACSYCVCWYLWGWGDILSFGWCLQVLTMQHS